MFDGSRRNLRSGGEMTSDSTTRSTWTFLTNHGHVLGCLAEEPDIRARDVATRVGITERAAQGIIADLVGEGYVTRFKEGRRNRYVVHPEARLRHALEAEHTIGDLLDSIGKLRRTHPTASTA